MKEIQFVWEYILEYSQIKCFEIGDNGKGDGEPENKQKSESIGAIFSALLRDDREKLRSI